MILEKKIYHELSELVNKKNLTYLAKCLALHSGCRRSVPTSLFLGERTLQHTCRGTKQVKTTALIFDQFNLLKIDWQGLLSMIYSWYLLNILSFDCLMNSALLVDKIPIYLVKRQFTLSETGNMISIDGITVSWWCVHNSKLPSSYTHQHYNTIRKRLA